MQWTQASWLILSLREPPWDETQPSYDDLRAAPVKAQFLHEELEQRHVDSQAVQAGIQSFDHDIAT